MKLVGPAVLGDPDKPFFLPSILASVSNRVSSLFLTGVQPLSPCLGDRTAQTWLIFLFWHLFGKCPKYAEHPELI